MTKAKDVLIGVRRRGSENLMYASDLMLAGDTFGKSDSHPDTHIEISCEEVRIKMPLGQAKMFASLIPELVNAWALQKAQERFPDWFKEQAAPEEPEEFQAFCSKQNEVQSYIESLKRLETK